MPLTCRDNARSFRRGAGCWLVAICLLLSRPSASAVAGEFNLDLNIGDPAFSWKDLPGVDGRRHSLADLRDKDVVVVVFTCNTCPYAVDYEDRLIEFSKQYARADAKVAVVAINANRATGDELADMRKRADQRMFPFAYLRDESQEVARKYGATRTPEFFVLNRQRKVVYMGAMDDNSDESAVQAKYLEPAVKAALAGMPVRQAETNPIGCNIRYKRTRRSNRQ